MKKPEKDAVVDTASLAAGVAGLAVTGFPGGGVLAKYGIAKLVGVLNRRNQRVATDYLEEISRHLDVGEDAEAAAAAERAIQDERFEETLAEGFDLVRSTFDAASRRCIAVMVADYLNGKRLPDRFYRRVASLMQECDDTLLAQLNSVCRQYNECAVSSFPLARRVLIRENSTSGSLEFWIHVMESESDHIQSSRCSSDANVEVLADLLVTHSFGHRWSGFSNSSFGGDPVLSFAKGSETELHRLGKYLDGAKAK